MRVRPGIELAGLSDVGCQRANNEDRYSYWEPADDQQYSQKGRLAIVADGMGGYEGGQEASRIAVEVIEEIYANAVAGDPRSWLLTGFHTAHTRIQDYAAKYPDLHGMGTTCTAIAVHRPQSLLRARRRQPPLSHPWFLHFTTHARSFLCDPPGGQRHHPCRRGRIASPAAHPDGRAGSGQQRYSGFSATTRLHSSPVMCWCCAPMACGACSAIARSWKSWPGKPSTEISHTLVETAKKRGGPDNITVQVFRFTLNICRFSRLTAIDISVEPQKPGARTIEHKPY